MRLRTLEMSRLHKMEFLAFLKGRNTPTARQLQRSNGRRAWQMYWLEIKRSRLWFEQDYLLWEWHRLGPCEDRSVIQGFSMFRRQRGRGRLGTCKSFWKAQTFYFANNDDGSCCPHGRMQVFGTIVLLDWNSNPAVHILICCDQKNPQKRSHYYWDNEILLTQ